MKWIGNTPIYLVSNNGNYNLTTDFNEIKNMEATQKTFNANDQFSFTSNEGFEMDKLVIDGKSEQKINNNPVKPSPDYPSEVECVKGKNLFNNIATSTTMNGVTFTINEDKTVMVNGTATADTSFVLNAFTLLPGNYFVRGASGGGVNTYAFTLAGIVSVYNDVREFTLTETKNGNAFIYVKSGITLNNVIFYPMISKENSTYLPYNAIQVKNVRKNLFDGIFELGIINGNTGQNGSSSNIDYIRNKNYIPVKELTNYKFSSPDYTGTSVFVYEYKEDFNYNLSLNSTLSPAFPINSVGKVKSV